MLKQFEIGQYRKKEVKEITADIMLNDHYFSQPFNKTQRLIQEVCTKVIFGQPKIKIKIKMGRYPSVSTVLNTSSFQTKLYLDSTTFNL